MAKKPLQVFAAALLVPIAIGNFIGGYAAAEHYSGQKLMGFLEGDWFFLFGFIGAAACLVIAVDTIRKTFHRD